MTPTTERLLETAVRIADEIAALAAGSDDERSFPIEEFRLIREAGLLAAPLARDLGGNGLEGSPDTALELLLLLKEIGRGNLSVGRVYEGHVNALHLIQTFGTSEQIDCAASEVNERGLLFGVWNTEAGDGVKIEPLGDGRYRLDGAKTFASGAGHVQRAIVPGALPDGGWQMTIVPLDEVAVDIDPSWWQPIGMRASASYRVDFTGVEIDQSNLLGAAGDYHRQPWFSAGAVRFAAVQLGGAVALLDALRDYLRGLERTGDPFQRMRAGQAAIAVETGNLWLSGAARHVDLTPDAARTDDPAPSIAYANMTRLAIERACQEVMQLVEHAVGARGLLRPHPVERIVRDLTLYLRQPAPDAALTYAGTFVLESEERPSAMWRNGDNVGAGRPLGREIRPQSIGPRPAATMAIGHCDRLNADPIGGQITDSPLHCIEELPLLSAEKIRTLGPTLVVAPHQDDESLGCGGAIALLCDASVPVHVLFVSDGSGSHPESRRYPAPALTALREREALAALDILGVPPTSMTFLRLPDRYVPRTGGEGFGEAVALVRRVIASLPEPPRTIFLPWRRDPHTDHRAAWEIVTGALAGTTPGPRVIEYPIWVWTLGEADDLPRTDEMAGWRLDISSVLERKLAAIAAHVSQTTPLIDDDPASWYLKPDMLERFTTPWEAFLEPVRESELHE